MDFEFEISNKVDENAWNEKLTQNKGSTLYQVPKYATIYQQVFDSKPVFITIKNSLGEIVGQLSALIHTKYYWKDTNFISKTIGSKLNLNSILIWNYGPIIHDDLHQNQILSKILSVVDDIATKNNITIIRGATCPLSQTLDSEIFKKYGYKAKNWATYEIDLQENIDDLYNKLSKETRYDVRKSEKNNLEFEVVNELSSYNDYADLAFYAQKRREEKRKKNSLFFEKFWNNLYDSGYLKVFLVKKYGELLGGIECLVFNKNIIQYSVANSPKTHLLGGSFLTWNAIKWSKDTKYLIYDMGGVNPNPSTDKEKSINFYKSKWGGRKLDYSRYTKILNSTKLKLSAALTNPTKIPLKIKKILC